MNEEQLIWQAQSAEQSHPAPEELRRKMEKLERRTRLRNRGGYQVCAFLFVACLWWLTLFHNFLSQAGVALTVAALAVMVWQIRATQLASRKAAQSGNRASLEFHREELARQRDFHRGRWLWTRILALAPGPILFLMGFYEAQPHLSRILAVEGITFVVFLIAAVPLNLRLARNYQRQLDDLERLQKDNS